MRIRTLTATVAAIALALTAGCGSSADLTSNGGGPADTSNSSTPASGDGGSPEGNSNSGTTELTAANFASVLTDKQLAAESVHMTMTSEAAGQTLSVEADMALDADPSKIAADMSMTVAGQTVRTVIAEGAVYTQVPGAGAGGKWMKIDLDAEGVSSLLGGMDAFDPASQLEMMKDAITSLEDSGETETIDGVETRRYDVVLDTSKIGSGLPAASQSALPDELTYQYWIGDDGLPRKVSVDLAQMPIEMTFSNWGEDVSVEAPPAADVVDGSSMLENLPTP